MEAVGVALHKAATQTHEGVATRIGADGILALINGVGMEPTATVMVVIPHTIVNQEGGGGPKEAEDLDRDRDLTHALRVVVDTVVAGALAQGVVLKVQWR